MKQPGTQKLPHGLKSSFNWYCKQNVMCKQKMKEKKKNKTPLH